MAGCSSDSDAGTSGASTTTVTFETTTTAAAETTTTMAPTTTTEASAVASPTIDQAFLAEQAAKSWDPKQPGAVMVSVYGPDGGVVYASVGTDTSGAEPTPDDLFRVGSISKLFTSLTVLSLVDDGLVDLDAPLSQYIDRVDTGEGVMVRDALQHRSGIPDYTESAGFLDMLLGDTSREWTPEETIALIPAGVLDFVPGSTFVYSNTNYIMLGLLIEEVTGLSYHEAVRSRLINPLKLTNTYLAEFEDGPAVFGGYYQLLGSIEPLTFDYTSLATSAWSAGAIVSNGQDLHTVLSALFAGEIISPELVTQMTANPEYGFAIFVPEFNSETPLFGHDGRIPGSGTFYVHAPETGMTVFTVSNAGHLKVTPATGDTAEAIGVRGVQLVSGD